MIPANISYHVNMQLNQNLLLPTFIQVPSVLFLNCSVLNECKICEIIYTRALNSYKQGTLLKVTNEMNS